MAFRGHYEYTLDAKNRLTVPAKFRAALSDGVVLAKSLEACVQIWTPEGWERFSERAMGSRDPFNPKARCEDQPLPNLNAPAHQATTRTVAHLSSSQLAEVAKALLEGRRK